MSSGRVFNSISCNENEYAKFSPVMRKRVKAPSAAGEKIRAAHRNRFLEFFAPRGIATITPIMWRNESVSRGCGNPRCIFYRKKNRSRFAGVSRKLRVRQASLSVRYFHFLCEISVYLPSLFALISSPTFSIISTPPPSLLLLL